MTKKIFYITGAEASPYTAKFNKIFPKLELVDLDEAFVQCLYMSDNGQYGNPTWFVSNRGRLLALDKEEPYFIKPTVLEGKPKIGYVWNPYTDSWIIFSELLRIQFR